MDNDSFDNDPIGAEDNGCLLLLIILIVAICYFIA